jgi:ATP-dependent DNA helicase RecQ
MDEEDIEEIVGYFKDSESDDLKSAMEELGDVYSDDEIRMVRIKFMSEMGI